MPSYEVSTVLTIVDRASAPVKRLIALLRDAQAQMEKTMGAFKLLQDAQAPGAAMLAAQRESLGLVQREADLRAGIAANVAKQSETQVAANRESLALAKAQLDVQRSIGATQGGRFISSANKAGNKLLWGGVGIVGGLAYATQKAMDFDQTTLQTDMALGGFTRSPQQRARDMAALQAAAFKGSQATGFFTAQDIMEGLQKAASSGMRPLVDRMGMRTFTAIVPTLAQYMDVLGRLKGESADTAALEAMQLVHMFGAYTPAAINKTLNGIAQLSLLMPDTMGKAISALSYVAPTGVQLAGMDVSDIAAFVATADQSGLGRGRSGARLKDYIESIAVRQSKARETAKTALGLRGAIGKDGSLDLAKSFDILIGDKKKMAPQAFRDAVRVAFGAQGDVVAAMFGDKQKTSMFQANRAAIQGSLQRGDLSTVQNILKGGEIGKEAVAWATLQNDIVQFGKAGIPIAIKFFDTINPKLKEFGAWMQQHPNDAKNLFDGLFKLGEGMLIVGGALKVVSGAAKAVTVIRGISAGIKAIELAGAADAAAGLIPFALAITAIAGIVKAVGDLRSRFPAIPGPVAAALVAANPALGTLLASLPKSHGVSQVKPVTGAARAFSHGASGSWSAKPTVHVEKVSVNVNLPKDSDPGYARRIAQLVERELGAIGNAPGYHVATGSNAVPAVG
jgi:hypothetical protein